MTVNAGTASSRSAWDTSMPMVPRTAETQLTWRSGFRRRAFLEIPPRGGSSPVPALPTGRQDVRFPVISRRVGSGAGWLRLDDDDTRPTIANAFGAHTTGRPRVAGGDEASDAVGSTSGPADPGSVNSPDGVEEPP